MTEKTFLLIISFLDTYPKEAIINMEKCLKEICHLYYDLCRQSIGKTWKLKF